MMQQVPFINREDELALIDSLIQAWGTRHVLCINAPGGIGKTRLLQEVRNRYATGGAALSSLLVTDILDFDDHSLHIPQNVGFRISQMLSTEIFKPYQCSLLDKRKMEIIGVSQEHIAQQNIEINQTFVRCFNNLAKQQRVILFVDTTDALKGSDPANYLLELASELNNTLILLAGRNARSIGEAWQVQLGTAVQTIHLPPLPVEAGEFYLQQKQELLHLRLEPELVQKLLFLSEGKPILLDLAVEWQSREIPFDWLATSSLAELQSLSTQERQKRQREFERRLVASIVETRQRLDWLILVMSRIYPLDVAMIAYLLGVDEDKAQPLFKKAQSYVFVKHLPDGRISLHDEMRRMINDYVWPEVDPDSDRQRQDSQHAVEYLESKIRLITEQINQLELDEQQAQAASGAQTEISTFLQIEALDRERWVLSEQQLNHVLFFDTDEGIRTFARMFDQATWSYRFRFRETLLATVQRYKDTFSSEQKFEIESRRITFLRDWGQYEQAKSIATQLLERKPIAPEQEVKILIERGNVEIRLGFLDQGIDNFQKAVSISEEHHLGGWLVRALNARGWAYRNQGDYSLALDDYLEAYDRSVELGKGELELQQTASILNNIGYVHALNDNRQVAFDTCLAALHQWEKTKSPRGIGMTHSTLGEIYTRFEQQTEALDHYQKALDIFTSENDVEWISIVRRGRATIWLAQGEWGKAEEDLKWSWERAAPNLKPQVLHAQARLHRGRGELLEAAKKLEECRQSGRDVGDFICDFKAFADLIDIAWENSEYQRWRTFYEELKQSYAERNDLVSLRLRGSSLRKIADLAMCQGDYSEALEAYKEGLELIALHEVHGQFTIRAQIQQMNQRLQQCVSKDVLASLGTALSAFWRQNKELRAKYPEALLIFRNWQHEEVML